MIEAKVMSWNENTGNGYVKCTFGELPIYYNCLGSGIRRLLPGQKVLVEVKLFEGIQFIDKVLLPYTDKDVDEFLEENKELLEKLAK